MWVRFWWQKIQYVKGSSRSNFVFAQALTLDLAVKIIIVTTLHYKYDNRCGCYCCNYCYNVEVIFAITTTTAAVVDNHFNCCCKWSCVVLLAILVHKWSLQLTESCWMSYLVVFCYCWGNSTINGNYWYSWAL